MNLRQTLAAVTACALSPLVSAQHMRPGLWEMATQIQLPPEQQRLMERTQASMKGVLEKMKPEERAKIEASMSGGLKPQISKVCLTEADAKADRPPGNMPASCKFNSNRSGSAMTTTWACDSPKTSGTANYAFTGGGTAYTSKATSETGGMKMTVTATGKWLGADCQGIKTPAEMMKK